MTAPPRTAVRRNAPLAALAILPLLAGCVQPVAYLPPPIALQPYPPPVTYGAAPVYRAPTAAPGAEPLPLLRPLPPAPGPATDDGSGPIPLTDMPAPATDGQTVAPAAATPGNATVSPAIIRPPTSGPGSNVPLEGFRPMRGQTRPAS